MAFFVQLPPSSKSQYQGELGKSLGTGLSNILSNFFINKELDKTLSDESFQQASPYERMSKLQQSLSKYGERGQNVLSQRLNLEQQRQSEEEQNVLAKAISGQPIGDKERSRLAAPTQLKLAELEKKQKFGNNIKQSLVKAGYPEETADLWKSQFESSPVGGQSDVIKQVNDLIRRSKTGKGIDDKYSSEEKPSIDIPGLENTKLDLDFPDLPEPVGLTPADVVKQSEHREKVLSPLYAETIDSLNALEDDYRDINTLQELNEGVSLPTGIKKWNVNWESGDLRIPALASPETQLYVKTIARMLGKAKEYFPGRVTNFDLETFKKRFPTLANSLEGRRLIAKQLELGNRIAYLKDETLKASIEHYGSGADPILVRRYANDNYRKFKGELESRLKNLDGLLETKYQETKDLEGETETESGNRPGFLQLKDPNGVLRWVPEDIAKRINQGK